MLVASSGDLRGLGRTRLRERHLAAGAPHRAPRLLRPRRASEPCRASTSRYLVETPEGRLVDPEIRAMCHFGHLNLLEGDRTAIVGRVDAVFCRNVLIYFDQESRRKVIDSFYERIAPGGYLLLGHSESPAQRHDRVRARPSAHRPRLPAARDDGPRREARSDQASAYVGRRRLGLQPARHRRPARVDARRRGRRQGRRRRRSAAPGSSSLKSRPHHARPRDAAHGRLHVPAPPDGAPADRRSSSSPGTRRRKTSSARSSSARSTSWRSPRAPSRATSRRSREELAEKVALVRHLTPARLDPRTPRQLPRRRAHRHAALRPSAREGVARTRSPPRLRASSSSSGRRRAARPRCSSCSLGFLRARARRWSSRSTCRSASHVPSPSGSTELGGLTVAEASESSSSSEGRRGSVRAGCASTFSRPARGWRCASARRSPRIATCPRPTVCSRPLRARSVTA